MPMDPTVLKARIEGRLAEFSGGFRPAIEGNDASRTKALDFIAYALGELVKEVRQIRVALDGEATTRLR